MAFSCIVEINRLYQVRSLRMEIVGEFLGIDTDKGI